MNGVNLVNHGGGGRRPASSAASSRSAELMAAPLFRSLPQLLVEHTDGDPVSGMLAGTAGEIRARWTTRRPARPSCSAG